MPRPELDVMYDPLDLIGDNVSRDRAKLTNTRYLDARSGETQSAGWILVYLIDDGSARHHYIGGDLLDVDEAVAEANRHLDGVFGT